MHLRLATYNLENLGVRADEDTPASRDRLPLHLDALRGVIRRLDADAVAFQELLDPALLEPLLHGMDYPHVAVGPRGSSELLCGVFSRHPLADAEPVAGDVDFAVTDPKSGLEMAVRGAFSRPALRVRWLAPGLPVTLFVVHWKSKIPSPTPSRRPGPGEPWASLADAAEGRLATEIKRLSQAVRLRAMVDRELAAAPRARVAVLGDFNDGLESEGVRIVAGDASACNSPSLRGAELVPAELSLPAELRFTQIYEGHREMLDHILLSPSLVPHWVETRAFNERLRETALPTAGVPEPGSDHAPLLVTLRV